MCLPQDGLLRHVTRQPIPPQRHVPPQDPLLRHVTSPTHGCPDATPKTPGSTTATCNRPGDPATATCSSRRTRYCDMYPASRPRASDMEQPGASPCGSSGTPSPWAPPSVCRSGGPHREKRPCARPPTHPAGHGNAEGARSAGVHTGIAAAGRETPTLTRPHGAGPAGGGDAPSPRRVTPCEPMAMGVSPAARAMPVGDRRSTAVRASGGLHFHANWRAAHVAAPPAGTATNTESAPATCTCRRTRYSS